MYREQAVRIQALTVHPQRVYLHMCVHVCAFGPFTLFESWSQKLVERASVFNNKTRNHSTEGRRGTNSTNQGTFCHIRLILHSLEFKRISNFTYSVTCHECRQNRNNCKNRG